MPSRRLSSSAFWASVSSVGAYVGAVLAHQQGDDLEAHPLPEGERSALDGRLHLAHRARQDGDDALVVLVAGVRRGAAAAALTLALGQGGPPGLGYASWNRRARVGSACTHGVEVWSGRQVRGGRRIGGDHSGTASGTLPPL